ncbi:hypothetical protein GGF42_007817, partial [Coemansia sp. RSA 2424]
MAKSQLDRLRELVAERGEDWDCIGDALGVLPSRARHNWRKYSGDSSAWSLDDTLHLQRLTEAGVKPKEAAKLLETKSHRACLAKANDIRQPDEEANMHPATSEVQNQLQSGSTAVDWLRVSQETGLSIHECLKHSQYNVGKAHWRYDPDLSSQSMADRMNGFIDERYPSPIPVNYRAMSNYLWIEVDDCMRMYRIFRGKFKWTKADLEWAAELRAQGLTFKEIARHLSPRLPGSSVSSALRRHSHSKPAAVPISADELTEMSRLVDKYAGKYSVVEIIAKIRAQLSLASKPSYFGKIIRRIAAHPHYKAKLRDIDYTDLANQIALGQMTLKLVAKELDVPRAVLAMNMESMHSKLYASQWVDEETRKLIDYVQGWNAKLDMGYFSKLLGTKSSTQCHGKLDALRRRE